MSSTTPTYVVELTIPGTRNTPSAWNCKNDGRPTEANLANYVQTYERSTRPGGVNDHLGPETVTSARIRRNTCYGDVVARYVAPKPEPAPMFSVIS